MLPPRHLLGTPRQHAAVRRIVLDDGPERGVRALAFSTGGGLDFWVLCDRGFDIGPLWWRGMQLAWMSPAGFPAPGLTQRWDDGGRGMERGFSGMLLTCGLEHMRAAADEAPLHGHLPYTPGRLLAHGEAWDAPEPMLFCESETIQYRLGGEGLRLLRRIEAPIGGCALHVRDMIENIGSEPQPIAVLYHINPGYPLVAEGTVATLDGGRILGPLHPPERANGPVEWHDTGGPDACATVSAPGCGVALDVSWRTDTLPGLQTWRNLRRNVGILGIEPCTAAPGAAKPVLEPGETRRMSLTLSLREQKGGAAA